MKVCFETFGCRLNRAEALDEEARYLAAGWELTQRHDEADRFVIRGCSVTARAQRDCEKLIAHLKRKYPTTRIIVQGCLSQQTNAAGALNVRIANRVRRAQDLPLPDGVVVPVPTRTSRAYLKVQDGCSGKCAFCIVPHFRGRSVSEPFKALLDRAKRFRDAGYHEIVVTGCNLSLYASEGKRLPDLLAALAAVGDDSTLENSCRIRLGSVEPGVCALETVSVIAEHKNICRFLHLPIQSGSNRILLAMGRPYLVKDIDDILQLAVKRIPLIGLGCDVMTGFPGETEMDFLATRGLLERQPFTNVHVFPFSQRPGTSAATAGGQVPKDVRSRRAHELAALTDVKHNQAAKRFRGHQVEVVIENEKEQAGWTSEYFWFKRSSLARISDPLPRKSLAKFQVTNSHHGELVG